MAVAIGARTGHDPHDGGVWRGQGGQPPSTAADNESWIRALHRLEAGRKILQLIKAASEGDGLAGEQLLDDRQRLGESLDARLAAVKRDAGGIVLAFQPAGANTEIEA